MKVTDGGSMILFVGDRPSKKNTHFDVAFKGTKSYKVLLSWGHELGLINFMVTNSHRPELVEMVKVASECKIIIALGNVAAKRLTKAKIPHLKMPHPSGRNRKLNDKEYVEEMLWDTKQRIELLRPVYSQYYQHPM
jgi:hypothetical protein